MANEFEIGQKVCYIPRPEYAEYQNGIVKSLHEDKDYVFVVYHCGGDWEHYADYTAAKTHIKYLVPGWYDKYTCKIYE